MTVSVKPMTNGLRRGRSDISNLQGSTKFQRAAALPTALAGHHAQTAYLAVGCGRDVDLEGTLAPVPGENVSLDRRSVGAEVIHDDLDLARIAGPFGPYAQVVALATVMAGD